MVDFKAMASSPELIGCASWSVCRNIFQGTMVLKSIFVVVVMQINEITVQPAMIIYETVIANNR